MCNLYHSCPAKSRASGELAFRAVPHGRRPLFDPLEFTLLTIYRIVFGDNRSVIARHLIPIFLIGCGLLPAQKLTGVGGNGQVVFEFFPATTPLTVEARDASGKTVPNLPVVWTITPTLGTLVGSMSATDANGRASTKVVASSPPQNTSFQQGNIVASTALGNVSFFFTSVPSRLPNGSLATPPQVELVSPVIANNRTVTGIAGQVKPGAIVVRVIGGGYIAGTPIPNVGVRLTTNDINVLPSATCNSADGIVLTDSTGIANCDVRFGSQAGTEQVVAQVGDYIATPQVLLTGAAGTACSYLLSEANHLFGPAGGNASVSVTTQANCPWTAASNAGWVTFISGGSGSGSGVLLYNVAGNAGTSRSATLTLGGVLYTVQQNSSALTLVSNGALTGGAIGQSYFTTLAATGGTPPYTWSVSGSLPPGLAISPSGGIISGVTNVAGIYSFNLTVTDSGGGISSQTASIEISTSLTPAFAISNTGFPVGTAGTPYQQALLTSGGCVSPFSKSPVFVLVSGVLPDGLSVKQISDNTFAIAGTPSAAGTSAFALRATDPCGAVATRAYSIAVQANGVTAAALTGTPSLLSFIAQLGGGAAPAAQTISIGGSVPGLSYSAAATTGSGVNWLTLPSGAAGTVPALLQVGVTGYDPLTPGIYSGSIVITSQSTNGPVIVPVTLTVVAAQTAFAVTPASVAFTVSPASLGTPAQQTVQIASSAGSIKFIVVTSGNPWLSALSVAGETPAALTIGVKPMGLAVGIYTGTVTIIPIGGSTPPQTIAVTMNVTALPTLTISNSNLTFAVQKGASLNPQILNVASSGDSIPYTATATSSWLSINNFQTVPGRTPATLSVAVNPAGLAPGTYTAAITIVRTDATALPVTIGVTLTIPAAALPTLAAVVNAASFARGPVAPGQIVTVFGTNFGPPIPAGLRLNISGVVDTLLSDTRIFFDGVPAPMLYSSSGQLSAVVPYSVRNKNSTSVQIEYQGALSTPLSIPVSTAAPGIFSDTFGQGAILNQDYSVNGVNNPAEPGSIVSIFATGEGDSDPPGVDGKLTTIPLPKPLLPVSVVIGGLPAIVTYAGGAPGATAGLLQVNAKIPDGVRRGVPALVQIQVGDATSQSGVTLAISP